MKYAAIAALLGFVSRQDPNDQEGAHQGEAHETGALSRGEVPERFATAHQGHRLHERPVLHQRRDWYPSPNLHHGPRYRIIQPLGLLSLLLVHPMLDPHDL